MANNSPTLTGKARRVVSAAQPQKVPGRPTGVAYAVRILRKEAPPATVRLEDHHRYLVGRHDAADISFDDEAVSRLHGVLLPTDDGWTFEDHGSSNGSVLERPGQAPFLIGQHQSIPVGVGDRIAMGAEGSQIEFVGKPPSQHLDEGSAVDATCRSTAALNFSKKLGTAARTRVPVFLLGPSGSGKTHSARQIHEQSKSEGAFVPINCARLPTDPSALHSELLGHVKGAFTGADGARKGKLIHADGGTLFLDEVESLSTLAQGFLLDVLEGTGDLAPLGAAAPRLSSPVFRLISASKVPLGETDLRDDLCERLAEGHLWCVPTLDERTDDIPGLIEAFCADQSSLLGVEVTFRHDAMTAATAARWPGQIRQLRATVNVLAQVAVAEHLAETTLPDRIHIGRRALEQHLKERSEAFGGRGRSVLRSDRTRPQVVRQKADPRALTMEQLEEVRAACGGNQSEAARRLGIARNTLARKLKEFGLS